MTDEQDRDISRIAERIADALQRLFGDPSNAPVFSAPERVGDRLVVTAAAWERAGGFGIGAGGGSDANGGRGSGSGGGGGGMSRARPVAVIDVSPDGVEVHPVLDATKIGITALMSAVGVWRMLRR